MRQSAHHWEGQAWQNPALGQKSLPLSATTCKPAGGGWGAEGASQRGRWKVGAVAARHPGATCWEPLVKGGLGGMGQDGQDWLGAAEPELSTKRWGGRLAAGNRRTSLLGLELGQSLLSPAPSPAAACLAVHGVLSSFDCTPGSCS